MNRSRDLAGAVGFMAVMTVVVVALLAMLFSTATAHGAVAKVDFKRADGSFEEAVSVRSLLQPQSRFGEKLLEIEKIYPPAEFIPGGINGQLLPHYYGAPYTAMVSANQTDAVVFGLQMKSFRTQMWTGTRNGVAVPLWVANAEAVLWGPPAGATTTLRGQLVDTGPRDEMRMIHQGLGVFNEVGDMSLAVQTIGAIGASEFVAVVRPDVNPGRFKIDYLMGTASALGYVGMMRATELNLVASDVNARVVYFDDVAEIGQVDSGDAPGQETNVVMLGPDVWTATGNSRVYRRVFGGQYRTSLAEAQKVVDSLNAYEPSNMLVGISDETTSTVDTFTPSPAPDLGLPGFAAGFGDWFKGELERLSGVSRFLWFLTIWDEGATG